MTIGDHAPNPTPQERRRVKYGAARQVVIAAGLSIAALIGLIVLAT